MSVAEDSAIEQSLRDFLAAAGVTLVTETPADAVIVLISESAAGDPEWKAQVERQHGVRLVPMRIDGVSSRRAPAKLRPVNWVNLDPTAPVTAFGTVLAAVLSDPEYVRALRNLRAEAEAWLRGNQSADGLIGDHGRASKARELLNVLREDRYIDSSGPVNEFVEASYRHTQKARTWRRRRRVAGTAFVVAMAIIVAMAVSRVLSSKGTQFNALVTYGDPASAREMPSWTSLQSARLLLSGNASQKALARQTLASLLSVPWSLGGPVTALDADDRGTLDGLALLPGGRRVAVLVRDASNGAHSVGLYDIREGKVLWLVRLGAGYADVSAGADGRTVVAVGRKGTAVVDLDSRKVRWLKHAESGYAVSRVTANDAIVVGRRNQLVVGSLDGGGFRTVGTRYDSLLSLERSTDGGARALVALSPGRYRLLDALTGKVLAQADVDTPLVPAGAVGPDRVYAVFAGADRQLWQMRPGRPPAPTGIATPERTAPIGLLGGGRVVVGGKDQRARVVRLADGSDLGVVCRDVPQLTHLVLPASGDLLGCFGAHNTTLWQAPAGPRSATAADSLHGEDRTGNATASVRGDGGSITVEPSRRAPFTMRLFGTDVTAVRLSDDGSQLVAASTSGDVAVVSLRMSDDVPRVVARWKIPGGGPVAAVGWSATAPLVQGQRGEVWTAPACPGCTTDEGLVARLRERLTGCWSERQLTEVDDDTRRTLGIRACRALPAPVED
ncbi:PQQ-like beta-propeller repeat protein [Streptomyces albipurpureus]|uniref:PQQ-like beta-propeller repeat protein n=1 Tax=Streptomyces albipurpureus TaxID=2897419 RepID=A0ABT0UI62_9ACTN|nr:PQQ-like beta-propeller repeat protein [Streptomyces sp. CWNU-1]MCM2388357.1 PQQ-like beta-propeller repeat protein [Streptomyces sp. CWNU-1]